MPMRNYHYQQFLLYYDQIAQRKGNESVRGPPFSLVTVTVGQRSAQLMWGEGVIIDLCSPFN